MLHLYSQTCQQLLICVVVFIHVQFWAEIDFFGPSLVGCPWKLVCWGSRQRPGRDTAQPTFFSTFYLLALLLVSWGFHQPFLNLLALFAALLFPLCPWEWCSLPFPVVPLTLVIPIMVLPLPSMVLKELLSCPLGVSPRAACSAPTGHQQCISRQTKLGPVSEEKMEDRAHQCGPTPHPPSSVFDFMSSQDFLASAITTWTRCQLSGVVF